MNSFSPHDSVATILDASNNYPLLTAEQEADVSKRIAAGHAAASSRSVDTGTRQRILDDATRARELLVCSNLKLVVHVSKRVRRRGLDFGSAVQEGMFGLLRAVDKFDYTKGYKFSTYATWWIMQAVQRGVAKQAQTIRTPEAVLSLGDEIEKTRNLIVQISGDAPSDSELAETVGITTERLLEVSQALSPTNSLDVELQSGTRSGDLIEDINAPDGSVLVASSQAAAELAAALNGLPEFDRQVILGRYGLAGAERQTLQQMASALGVNREKVRVAEIEAINLLRRRLIQGGLAASDFPESAHSLQLCA